MGSARLVAATRAVVLALVVVALAVPAVAGAQEQAGGQAVEEFDQFRLVFRAGASFAHLRGELAFDDVGPSTFEPDFGFAAAAGVEFRLTRHVSFQPEAVIVRRFTELELGDGSDVSSSKLSVNYLELPLLLKWHLQARGAVHPTVLVGPVAGIRLQASRELRRDGELAEVPVEELLEPRDWAVAVGAGFEFVEAFADFVVDLRYLHGLSEVSEDEASGSARWSGFQLTVGVVF